MFQYEDGCGIVRMKLSLSNLASVWSRGAKVWLQDGRGVVYSGLILGIRVESGYCVGNSPKGYIVDIDTDVDVVEVHFRD